MNIRYLIQQMIFWSKTIIFFTDNIDYCQDISSCVKVVTQIVNHIRITHVTSDIRIPKSNSMLLCYGKTWCGTTLRQIVFSITDDTLIDVKSIDTVRVIYCEHYESIHYIVSNIILNFDRERFFSRKLTIAKKYPVVLQHITFRM